MPPIPPMRRHSAAMIMRIAGAFFSGFLGDHRLGGDEEPATDAASCSAMRTTLVGSMMPASPCRHIRRFRIEAPIGLALSVKRPMTIEPSTPAFSAICRTGHCRARRTMSMPTFWSSFAGFSLVSDLVA